MDQDLKRELSASKMRLRSKSPYFSVLASYLKPIQVGEGSHITTAATDAKHLYVNRAFWMRMSPVHRDFVLVHEVLHAALGHCHRCGPRNPLKWNVAADLVVNIVAVDAGFSAPPNLLLDQKFRGMLTEEVYRLLPEVNPSMVCPGDVMPSEDQRESEGAWRTALAQASAASRMFGNDPLGEKLRIILEKPTVDWRKILWSGLAQDQQDFSEWDQRLVGDELFVEELVPEEKPKRCAVCIDTSGSTMGVLGKFCGEVLEIGRLRGSGNIDLYFADTELIGPLKVEEAAEPRGGGGTSFVPFFEEVGRVGHRCAIYLTDLCGQFPDEPPAHCDVVWVVPPGAPEKGPFGRTIRILD